MKRIIILILIIILQLNCGSYEIDKIIPESQAEMDKVISGSISKNIDMTLENCIKIALGNNPEITAAFQDILINDNKLKQIWTNFFPVISWQTSWSHIKQLQLSDVFNRNLEYEYYILGQISLEQMLYDFGVTQNQATIQRLGYEASKKTFAAIVNDIIYRTKDCYYKVLYAYEAEKVAQKNVNNFQSFYNQAKALYSVGLNPKVDVTIAQANLSKAKMNLIAAKNLVNTSVAELNNIMGVPYISKYTIRDELKYSPMNLNFEQIIMSATESRPELKRAKIEVEKARQNIKLNIKTYFPSLTAQAQYQRGGRHWTSNDGWNIGVYFNFPNVNILYNNLGIKEAKLLYDKELASARKTQNDIYLEIQTAYLKLHERETQLPVAEIQLKQAQENYELSNGRYKVGEASPIELKEAQNTLAESQLAFFEALYLYNSAKAALEKAIGKNLSNEFDNIDLNKESK